MSRFFILLVVAISASGVCTRLSQAQESVFGIESAGISFGPYARVTLGYDSGQFNDGRWLPPGASDPQIFFDLSDESGSYGSAAIGYDWMNGFRSDVSLSFLSGRTTSGDWSFTIPATPGSHASMSADISSTAVIASLYYSPLEAQGKNLKFNPYVMAGLGVARHSIDSWTRTNPAVGNPVRSFASNTNSSLAWTVGVGGSWLLSKPRGRPIYLDMMLQHYDFGKAEGSATNAPGSTGSAPRAPLSFERSGHMVSIGLRIPLTSY